MRPEQEIQNDHGWIPATCGRQRGQPFLPSSHHSACSLQVDGVAPCLIHLLLVAYRLRLPSSRGASFLIPQPLMLESGYNGLQAYASTTGVTVLTVVILYGTKCYHLDLSDQENFSRNCPWHSSDHNDPLAARPDKWRRSLVEKPEVWDVWIISWYPLYSRPESWRERLGLSKGGDEDEKHDASCTADDQRRPGWGEFLVSCIHSLNPFFSWFVSCARTWFPEYPTTVCR